MTTPLGMVDWQPARVACQESTEGCCSVVGMSIPTLRGYTVHGNSIGTGARRVHFPSSQSLTFEGQDSYGDGTLELENHRLRSQLYCRCERITLQQSSYIAEEALAAAASFSHEVASAAEKARDDVVQRPLDAIMKHAEHSTMDQPALVQRPVDATMKHAEQSTIDQPALVQPPPYATMRHAEQSTMDQPAPIQ